MTNIETSGSIEPSPLDELHEVTSSDQITPEMIQRAINLLNPNSQDAAAEAEIVQGYAEFGLSMNPDSLEWFNIADRANTIYQNRIRSR